MSKSRPFTIYLLKTNYNASNALQDEHDLDAAMQASNLPAGASLFVLDGAPYNPWWQPYFQISTDLRQTTKGALVFLPVAGRCFALCFGHVGHNLKDESYEYDFGLLVTLNSVDRNKLKSTDILEPSEARRKTIQPAVASDLTFFDFDRDSNILKKLTGKVKDEYQNLFKQATGASSLRISSDVAVTELPSLCSQLLTLYQSQVYKDQFPGIRSVEPVKEPSLCQQLDAVLLQAFISNDDRLQIAVPEIVNYDQKTYFCFLGLRKMVLYDDAYLGDYRALLADTGADLAQITINDLRKHRLAITDDNGVRKISFSIYKCLVFETQLVTDAEYYHLCEGEWYRVEKDYLTELREYINQFYEDHAFDDYSHESEGKYNAAFSLNNPLYLCFDTENISPAGEYAVEPCDLYTAINGKAVFCHIKVSTLSQKLSHLFNQGTNSIELIKSEPNSKTKLRNLIQSKIGSNDLTSYLAPVDSHSYKVIYAIVTRKDKNKKAENIPLFSCISLKRSIKTLQLWSVQPSFCFINNTALKKPGQKKKRKKKAAKTLQAA